MLSPRSQHWLASPKQDEQLHAFRACPQLAASDAERLCPAAPALHPGRLLAVGVSSAIFHGGRAGAAGSVRAGSIHSDLERDVVRAASGGDELFRNHPRGNESRAKSPRLEQHG